MFEDSIRKIMLKYDIKQYHIPLGGYAVVWECPRCQKPAQSPQMDFAFDKLPNTFPYCSSCSARREHSI